MSVEIETVEALLAIMKRENLTRIEAGGIILERGQVFPTEPPKQTRDPEERPERHRHPAPGLGHYANEDLWPEGEVPWEILAEDTPGANGPMR